jgi:hypothetical protein
MNFPIKEQSINKLSLLELAKKIRVPSIYAENAFSNYINKVPILNNHEVATIKSNNMITTKYKHHSLILKYTSEKINELEGLKQQNRNQVIESIKQLLNENTEKFVYRLDIKSFYETIYQDPLYDKVLQNNRFSPATKKIIRNFLNESEILGFTGVPRGISLSASLAEFYIKEFDLEISNYDDIYYYARFVDDIIIFSTQEIPNIRNLCESILPTGLTMNTGNDKFNEIKFTKKCNKINKLSFLGYTFEASTKNGISRIDISESKSNKIINRISKSIVDFSKTNDIKLLILRMKYLSGNRYLKLFDGRNIAIGIFYNYRFIDSENSISINKIEKLYKAIFYSEKFRLYKLLKSRNITKKDLNFLKNISFSENFKNKTIYNIKESDVKKIKKCWYNE